MLAKEGLARTGHAKRKKQVCVVSGDSKRRKGGRSGKSKKKGENRSAVKVGLRTAAIKSKKERVKAKANWA